MSGGGRRGDFNALASDEAKILTSVRTFFDDGGDFISAHYSFVVAFSQVNIV